MNRRLVFATASACLGVGLLANAGVSLSGGPAGTNAVTTAVTNSGLAAAGTYNSPNKGYRFQGDTTQELHAPQAFWSCFPVAMNASGQVIGGATSVSDNGQPLFWDAGASVPIELSRSGSAGVYNSNLSDRAFLTGINDAGSIVGSMVRRNTAGTLLGRTVVRWENPAAAPVELHGLALSTGSTLGLSYATAQNQQGATLGYSLKYLSGTPREGARAALRWQPGSSTPQRLDDLSPSETADRFTIAYGINESNVAVGSSDWIVDGVYHGRRAVRWDPITSAVTPLDAPSINAVKSITDANVINARGDIVGYSDEYDGVGAWRGRFPVRWDAGGTAITELATLGPQNNGRYDSSVTTLNELGAAAGYSRSSIDGVDAYRATLWLPGSAAVIDLNSYLGAAASQWTLRYATSLSDTGWIGGQASYDSDGPGPGAASARAYSMLVPEAGTYGRGDANFDTRVDFDDLLILAQHYGESNPTQDVHVGDFDLNGSVNFDDLLAIAQHYGSFAATVGDAPSGAEFAADWALARSLVPEPAAAGALAAIGGLARRRR